MPSKLLFLPGASGDARFWLPVAERLAYPADKLYLEWPGFGPIPPDPRVNSMHDLVSLAVAAIDQPVAVIAQSMGGVIAVQAIVEKSELLLI